VFRPTPLGQQSDQPAGLEGDLHLVSSWNRDPEQLSCIGHRFVVDEMPPHHFVADLQ
jgi:hypothetical protein